MMIFKMTCIVKLLTIFEFSNIIKLTGSNEPLAHVPTKLIEDLL